MRWIPLLFLVGCGGHETWPVCDDAPAAVEVGSPTWHRDVRPIVQARCVRCHDYGGVGGFSLDRYDDAVQWSSAMKRAVQERRMPPWGAAHCCRSYRDDFSLDDTQIATVAAWVDRDTPEGDPADFVPLQAPSTQLPRVDLSVAMPVPHTPALGAGQTDETRCFLLDWPEDERRYVVGLGLRPGNPAIVHHAIVLTAAPANLAYFDALDAADPAPGWLCPGGLVYGYEGWVGGWTPGWEAQQIPDGLGQAVPAGGKLILTMHYSVVQADPQPDQTTVDLMLADEVTGTLEALGVYDPAWPSGGMHIPADDPDVVHSYRLTPPPRDDGAPRRLLAANLHMHERGARGQVGIEHADGRRTCLLQIDAYDARWQSNYLFDTAVELAADDALFVECHFDNTAGNQRIVDGRREPVRALNWAEDQEMCVAYVTAAQ